MLGVMHVAKKKSLRLTVFLSKANILGILQVRTGNSYGLMWENYTLRCSELDIMTLFICVISEDWKKQTIIAGKPHTGMTISGLTVLFQMWPDSDIIFVFI
jgi:hypothetical protein